MLIHKEALWWIHDAPTAGHQGVEKTLDRLWQEVYWVSMARDVEWYCRECTKRQQYKLSMPQCAPLTSLPIGRPWQMIVVDILEVLQSVDNNSYLLVVQDYCGLKLFHFLIRQLLGLQGNWSKSFQPLVIQNILHSDQGCNFRKLTRHTNTRSFWCKNISYHQLPSCWDR